MSDCHCNQPWSSTPPMCAQHPRTLSFYGGIHALERQLLRRLRASSYVASTDAGPRLFFTADWVDLTPAQAALLNSLED